MGKQLGLTLNWATEHQFGVLAFSNVKNKRAPQPLQGKQTVPVTINQFDVDFALDEPNLRAMVSECGRVFYDLQQRRYGLVGGSTQTIDFVEISQRYRLIVRHAIDKIKLLIAEPSNSPEPASELCRQTYEAQIRLFYGIECTWHLIEFLLLDNNKSAAIVMPLLEWIRYHFPRPAQEANELLKRDLQVEHAENYWSVMKSLVLQGQTMIARALLRLHVSANTHGFRTADQLLQSIPIYSVYGGLSVHKFQTQWQCWCRKVQTLLDTGTFTDEPYLEEILRLVIGDQQVWAQQLSNATSWYEYFPGYLLYTDSTCKYYQLTEHVSEWMAKFREAQPATGREKLLDKLVLAVMENDLMEVVRQVQGLPDNGWFAVHLVDLLHHAGQLLELGTVRIDETGTSSPGSEGGERVDLGKLVRDSVLYDYGTLLMSHPSLWMLGIEYLEFSSTLGLGAQETLLARIPIRNESQARKILAVARKQGYVSVEAEVCKVLTKRFLALKRYGSALDWAIRSGDSAYVCDVANIFLEHYCNHGELLCESLVANLGAEVFISSRLVFLKKYYDFRQFYQEQAYAKAAELLVNLMDSKIMPSYFWPCLMSDAIPLLEFKEPIIPSKETLIILEHLQMDLVPMLQQRQQKQGDEKVDTTDSQKMALIPKFASNLLNNCTEDLIKMLRLACARNLSRALIIENTISG
ncbi:nuclear pore complex protein Nup75 [Anopheles cruzii]|uniref:nuclear pore complex protein Nup75 n=1 Tax=Anopheles cruzii TaxID=68878 RepID=UPI0022EC41EE|nr:nuclear pore complex protein Nup75 [Anopheles cruzii]